MVKLKKASKRMPASHKFNIEKKVREHNRKLRRGKIPTTQKKSKKDPGIPNLLPFREKVLQEVSAKRRLDMDHFVRQANRAKDPIDEQNFCNGGSQSQKYQIGTENGVESLSNSFSNKSYYKEFKKVVEESDVVLQVLDARDPLGCRTKRVEEYVLQQNKKLVLVLNKIDLVPKENVEAWLKYLRHEFPTVAFKACTQNQRRNLAQLPASASSSQIQSSGNSFGAETLVKLLKNYACNQQGAGAGSSSGSKPSILVGVIGYPNVGKSSLINSIVRSRVCNVGATAGITQTSQQIHLDRQVKLLDCPGIVFSQGTRADRDLLLRNCVAVEDIIDPIAAVSLILARCSKSTWKKVYGIPDFSSSTRHTKEGADVSEFLLLIARKLGRLKKGGIADLESAAITVLRDWNMGKIPFYSVPPKVHPNQVAGSSTIVSEFSKEFKLEEISAEESLLLSSDCATSIIPDNSHRFYVKMGITEDHLENDDVDMDAEISSMSEEEMSEEEQEMDLKEKKKKSMAKTKNFTGKSGSVQGQGNQFYDFDEDMGGVSVSEDDEE